MDFELKRIQYIDYFEQYGDMAASYLRDHAYRFLCTHELVVANLASNKNAVILDIASHWLHNAYLYAQDGYRVIALDQSGGEISTTAVTRFAGEHGIELLPCAALNNPVELEAVADNSVDIVMFTEAIEHITFNPVRFWSLIYKKMKVGGKIIITTPNYFYFRGAFTKDLKKMLGGFSSGISNHDILHVPDYAPHWKEFSAKDMHEYFALLSADFKISRLILNDLYGRVNQSRLYALCQKLLPGFFHRTMYLEVELLRREAGIQVVPQY